MQRIYSNRIRGLLHSTSTRIDTVDPIASTGIMASTYPLWVLVSLLYYTLNQFSIYHWLFLSKVHINPTSFPTHCGHNHHRDDSKSPFYTEDWNIPSYNKGLDLFSYVAASVYSIVPLPVRTHGPRWIKFLCSSFVVAPFCATSFMNFFSFKEIRTSNTITHILTIITTSIGHY